MSKDPNEVGASWRKSNDKGEFFSISLDLDALAQLRGGVVDGKVDLNMYAITFPKTNDRAPDYRVKFYTRTRAAGPRPAATPALRRPPVDPDMDEGF